jgi:hypothetical protein
VVFAGETPPRPRQDVTLPSPPGPKFPSTVA